MEIRKLTVNEIPGMIELLKQVGEVHHRIRPDIFRAGAQKYDFAALEELLQDDTRPIFGAVEEGRLLGYCFCQMEERIGHPVLRDEKWLYIDDLCVDENCRGQHIGKGLYEFVYKYAKEMGCGRITLNVWCGNDSAMAFYEKRGLTRRNIYMETAL